MKYSHHVRIWHKRYRLWRPLAGSTVRRRHACGIIIVCMASCVLQLHENEMNCFEYRLSHREANALASRRIEEITSISKTFLECLIAHFALCYQKY